MQNNEMQVVSACEWFAENVPHGHLFCRQSSFISTGSRDTNTDELHNI